MSSFWRFTLLGLFAAAGIGVALGVALSSNSSAESAADNSAAEGGTAFGNFAAGPGGPISLGRQQAPAAQPTAKASTPLLEQVSPPIAGPVSAGNTLLAQATSPSSIPAAQTNPQSGINLLAQTPASNPLSNNLNSPPPGYVNPPGTSGAQPTQAEVVEQLRSQLQQALQAKQNGAGGSMEPTTAKTPANLTGGNTNPSNVLPAPMLPLDPGKADGSAKSKPRITKIPGEGDHNLSIHLQDADLRDVLELLSEQGGLNILPSPSVQGKVSASLNGVDIDTALSAILRSTGYVARHDGPFIYVGTPQDFKAMAQAADTIGTRVYHINYVRSNDIQALVTPLLTPGVGSISITAPAEEGIGSDSSKAGGNNFAGGEAVLVHDFVSVLDQVDQVIAEVDHKPAQVSIEAMILKVTLDDTYDFGVSFDFLQNNPNVRLVTGDTLPSPTTLTPNGGLQFAFLQGNTGAFLSALESIADTNVISSPRLMVVDKSRAEILIGKESGYVNSTVTETSTAQNVQFLETGTSLRLRPFISSDGMVRMEVHPELSDGGVTVTDGFTLPNKTVTQVTTNVMIPDGCTVVIGGLMHDELETTTSEVPLLGSMPVLGVLFRHKHEETHKIENIVLITPHIVCEPDACCEGDKVAAEFHRGHAVYADQMSPLGKRYLGRKYYRLAQAAWAKGDQETALRFIDLSIHFDPISRAAIDLRSDIWNGHLTGDHTLLQPGMVPGEEIPAPGAMTSAPPGVPLETIPGIGTGVPAKDLHQAHPGGDPSATPPPGKIEQGPSALPLPMDTTGNKSGDAQQAAGDLAPRPLLAPETKPIPPSTDTSVISAKQWLAAHAEVSYSPLAVPAMPDMPSIGFPAPASPVDSAALSVISAENTANRTTSDAQSSDVNNALNSAPISTAPLKPAVSNPLDGGRLPAWIFDDLIKPASDSSAPPKAAEAGAVQP